MIEKELLLNSFLSFLQLEKGLSENTIKSYRVDIDRYISFVIKEVETLDSITEQLLHKYIAKLIQSGLITTSVNRHFSAIKGFHKHLIEENISKIDPTEYIDSLKIPKRLPEILTIEEIDLLLEQPDI